MARIKIDYGIDLGTTNSAICRMEKGEPMIIKSDTLKDTLPSCVSINKKGSIKCGDGAYNTMKSDKRRGTKIWKPGASNTFIEFKRTMATDTKYPCSNVNKDFSSEELSAEVLKTLKSFVSDETFSSVVVTVPAKFTVNQKTATIEAAKMAGFKKCELLQEPIAASMAYGLKADDKNGIWMVFDFGGGTFDAALLKVEDGIMQVFDTEGDNYLGGKNLDYAIVDEIIIPYLQKNYSIDGILNDEEKKQVLRDAMKTYAEDAKNQLSFKDHEDIISNLGDLGEDEDGEELELDLTIKQSEAFKVMRPYFQKAVNLCNELLKRNNLKSTQVSKLILVGGPTHCPLIRQMLKEQVTPNVDSSIDPMTAVAVGAALYASTIDADVADEDVSKDTIRLDIDYPSTTVQSSEYVTVQLSNDCKLPKVTIEMTRSDKAWSSGKIEVDKNGNVIELMFVESKPNLFSIEVYNDKGDRLPCFPNEITIIQGTKVGSAPLPYNIGIAVWSDIKKKGVFTMAKGLEKNKPVPAVGVVNDLRTTSKLRPGVESDTLKIPVYQVDDFSEAEGRSVALYEYVSDVSFTGDDVKTLIPDNSPVDVTLRVDASEQMTVEVHFLSSDETVEKKLDTSKKQSVEEAEKFTEKYIKEAQHSIDSLHDGGISTDALQDELNRVKEEAINSSEKKAVLQHLKEVLRKIEDEDSKTEWQRVEKELHESFDRLEKAQAELGNEKSAQLVNQLHKQTDEAIHKKDVRTGRELNEQIEGLFVHLTILYQCMGFIQHYNSHYGSVKWKDAVRARQLLNKGMQEMNNQPTVEKLHPIVCSVIELMPDDQKPIGRLPKKVG